MRYLLAATIIGLNLSGCASINAEIPRIAVETVDSRFAHIRAANVTPTDTGFWVRGTVTRRFHKEGPIYGHLHLDLLNANGEMIEGIVTKPTRRNAKARSAKFAKQLNAAKTDYTGAAVRITHHFQSHAHM